MKPLALPELNERAQFAENVWQALKQWHEVDDGSSPLAHLFLYRKTLRGGYMSTRQVTNQVLLRAIETLQACYDEDVRFLQMRFWDRMSVQQIANKFNVAESKVYSLQRDALERLADVLYGMEQNAGITQKRSLERRLPPPTYVNLIGIVDHLAYLDSLLTAPKFPWLLAVEGMGGLGKTSLADALVRQLIQRGGFDQVSWVSAQQRVFHLDGEVTQVGTGTVFTQTVLEMMVQQLIPELAFTVHQSSAQLFAALQTRLKETPHLIVVDNLETVADVESLLPTLQSLANPTKFLLTTRASLYSEPNLFHFRIPELSETDALQLIRQEAQLGNLPVLALSSDAELRPIFETVGGNPLAIRLVVGQNHIYPLESILYDLRAARSQTADNFYTFIYQRAWENLDALHKRVFLIMPLAHPSRGDLGFLAEVGDLDVGEVRMALNKLVALNLVDVHGGVNERRYSIHALTRTFLEKQVAKWL